MLKKALILGMILSSLLFVSTITVSAATISKTIIDDIDDVIEYDFSDEENPEKIVSSKPNIDIKMIKYEQNGQSVTVTLTVKGKIENRGNLEDYLAFYGLSEASSDIDFSFDFVMYEIDILTVLDTYTVIYVNNACNISYSGGFVNQKSLSVKNNELKISFDLQDDEDTYESFSAATTDIKLLVSVGSWYIDIAPDPKEFEVTISGPSQARVNETVRFSSKAQSDYSNFEWAWDFGDGVGTSDVQNPTYKFEEPGTYEVYLEVMDSNLNFGFDSFTINIVDSSSKIDNDDMGATVSKEETLLSPILIFIILIAIIVIAGIAVLIRIIKK